VLTTADKRVKGKCVCVKGLDHDNDWPQVLAFERDYLLSNEGAAECTDADKAFFGVAVGDTNGGGITNNGGGGDGDGDGDVEGGDAAIDGGFDGDGTDAGASVEGATTSDSLAEAAATAIATVAM
jgi:hypothetical protein